MKKILNLSGLLLAALLLAGCASAPKEEKTDGTKLDAKTKFAIDGVELGSFSWPTSSVNDKGEIHWTHSLEGDWHEIGWDARGVDLSAYGAIRVTLAPGQNQNVKIILSDNPATFGEWGTETQYNDTVTAYFNGLGKSWGDMKNPDLEEGFRIRLQVPARKYEKTVIKSVELIKKEDVPDVSHLEISGVLMGSICQNHIAYNGKEIIWTKGYKDSSFGWNLSGVDLSEYDRIRIEVENNTATGLGLRLCSSNWENWHGFEQQIEPNVWEADLTGEGASWKLENAEPFDKSKGMFIVFQNWHENPLTKEERTVVKSVQLLKGKKVMNEHLMIGGVAFGTDSYHCKIYDGGVIEWDSKEKDFCGGWDVRGVDLSEWEAVRIEIKSSDVPLDSFFLSQEGCSVGVHESSKNIFEIKLAATNYEWISPQDKKWDSLRGVEQIRISPKESAVKAGSRTVVKSVTLLKNANEVPQPEALVLNGAKLGSKREQAYLDDDFAINWKKAKYANCGWKLENLEAGILEIKVSSTDVPLRLRIKDLTNDNDASWIDDGSHIFRIHLDTKQQETKIGLKPCEWQKKSDQFGFFDGVEIALEPANGVFKEGKKTVIEYVKVE
ncbi:MAG: hypothetical protein MJ185_06900 [Treponema sp.]|nr:hypothetical protein [Treponema sp.]